MADNPSKIEGGNGKNLNPARPQRRALSCIGCRLLDKACSDEPHLKAQTLSPSAGPFALGCRHSLNTSRVGCYCDSSLEYETWAGCLKRGRPLFIVITPRKLRTCFRRVSGFHTHHAAITQISDGKWVIEFDGFNPDGSRFHIRSLPFSGPPIKQIKRTIMLARLQRSTAPLPDVDFGERPMAQLSGNLAQMMRDSIDRAKARAAKSHEDFAKAVTEFSAAHDEIDAASEAMQAEARELKASIAGLTNAPIRKD